MVSLISFRDSFLWLPVLIWRRIITRQDSKKAASARSWYGTSAEHREKAIGLIKDMIRRAKQGESFSYKSKEISVFDELFAWNNSAASEERRHFRQLVFTF